MYNPWKKRFAFLSVTLENGDKKWLKFVWVYKSTCILCFKKFSTFRMDKVYENPPNHTCQKCQRPQYSEFCVKEKKMETIPF
jgi:hypothetical protein